MSGSINVIEIFVAETEYSNLKKVKYLMEKEGVYGKDSGN